MIVKQPALLIVVISTFLGTINGLHFNAFRLKSKFTPKIYDQKLLSVINCPCYVSMQNIVQKPNGFNLTQHFCGGAIINNRWILAAAHCMSLMLPHSSVIFVGASSCRENCIVHHYDEIIVHHSFDLKSSIGDIAMLKTRDEIDLSEYIQPVNLHTKYFDGNYEGFTCGFKSKQDDFPFYNFTSKHSRTLNASECHLMVDSEMKKMIHPSVFCTFDEDKEVLDYDEMGSLFLIDDNLAGITTWKSNDQRKIKQFTRISLFLGWIENQISPSVSIKL